MATGVPFRGFLFHAFADGTEDVVTDVAEFAHVSLLLDTFTKTQASLFFVQLPSPL